MTTSIPHLIAILPHPDDEILLGVGAMSACVRMGGRLTWLFLTRGEGGTDRQRRVQKGRALGRLREMEACASARKIGAETRFCDFPDGELVHQVTLVPELTSVFLELKPSAILTFGLDGAYGHQDHVVSHQASAEALREAGLQGHVRHLQSAYPRGLFDPVRRPLKRMGLVRGDGTLGCHRRDVDYVFKLGPLRKEKEEALACHGSQLLKGQPGSFLRDGLMEVLFEEEWFVVASGPNLAPDAEHLLVGL